MKKKYKYATGDMMEVRTPAICSRDISHIDDIRPGPAVIYIRVSSKKQDLEQQKSHVLNAAKERGFNIIDVFKTVISGSMVGSEFDEESALERAVMKANQTNAVIIAESVDRFFRGGRNEKSKRLSKDGMRRLLLIAEGVPLVTVTHPDASPSDVRSAQSKRGQSGRGNYGGRKKITKKARRKQLQPQAVAMNEAGDSLGKIAKRLRVPKSTVQGWISSFKTVRLNVRAKSRSKGCK